MKLSLYLNKSIEENASLYFEKAKKSKKKIEGIKTAIFNAEKKKKLILEKFEVEEKKSEEKVKRKEEWYEKFRWFVSSEGFFVVGGRDATTNEIIIKKYTEKDDVVFHTDMSGSPFFVVKASGKKIGLETLQEVADATLAYSRAWKLGMATSGVFWVKPEQVSKEAQPGEYLSKGAFMIRGKTNYIHPRINLAVGIMEDGKIMGGPLKAVKKNCLKFVEIKQGSEKTSSVAKKIKAKIGGSLDDIIKVIPAGGVEVR